MAIQRQTRVYLEAAQKAALNKLAKAKGTKIAEEIRNAVDAYLTGATTENLKPLDAASREAGKHLDAMVEELDAVNRKLDAVFAEMERIRGRSPASLARRAALGL